ncbi:hypothetical protein [Rhizobium mesosinicum]|uniref:Uncharacterized protein n=1 Tax=Rhizobium mesosinicum TaxID=335017 RepID=A0ABS7GMY9_9HYPH|nr:hypothetical protein [Rhizobium mesosinicum]MBW9051026.1 hypothetical protein [Rhizobium mesosinicum]
MRFSVTTSLLALGIASCALPSRAQDLSNLNGMAALTGSCEKLIMAGRDFSDHCGSQIIHSIYNNGRTGFTVTLGDKGTVATFSGLEGAKPDADTQLQDLDMVIFNLGIEGVPPTTTAVKGGCGYSNPYKGPMTISCQATSSKGEAYLLQFRSDGSPPKMTDLRKPALDARKDGAGTAFAVGEWVGSAMADDPDRGCLVTKQVDRKTAVMLYANKNEAFTINIFNRDWNFGSDAQVTGELAFDGKLFPLSGISVRNEQILTLEAGAEEESLEAPVKNSSKLTFRTGKKRIETKLSDSAEAIEKLWDCVDRE